MGSVLSNVNGWIASVITRIIDIFYLPVVRRFVGLKQFRYILCGVGNYIVLDAVLYYLIYHYVIHVTYINIGIHVISPHVASLTIVFPITFLTGFWLNRYVAFSSTQSRIRPQMFRYGVSVVGSIVLSYILLKLLVERADMWATPAKVLCSIITAIYSYTMARLYTFKQKKY